MPKERSPILKAVKRRIRVRQAEFKAVKGNTLLKEAVFGPLLNLKLLRKELSKPLEPSLQRGECDWDMDD
jgi:hypothetical protein